MQDTSKPKQAMQLSQARIRSSSARVLDQNKVEAEIFLQEAFKAYPMTIRLNEIGFTKVKKLGGGKSGAEVWDIQYRGNSAILKIYENRGLEEKVFRQELSTEEKNMEYRKIKGINKGDAILSYIRSVRDVYLNILLNGIRTATGDTLTPTLLQYGFLKGGGTYKPFMITENLVKQGYQELLKFKQKDNNTLSKLKILRRIVEAVEVKHESIRTEEGQIVGCHRDLHPGNIFWTRRKDDSLGGFDYSVKLIDFDLSITDSDILSLEKACDRKTMSNNKVKKLMGQWNKTFAKYVGWANSLKKDKAFKGTIAEKDADLYMVVGYLSTFLKGTEALTDIEDKVRKMKGLNRISGSTKKQFIAILKAAIQEQIYKEDAIIPNSRDKAESFLLKF
jgi:serine/threonine protein kinase